MDNKILLKRDMTLGTGAAENDGDFLSQCFVETPEYKILRNFSDKKTILLGRTGTGKTALLKQLKEDVDVYIEIKPNTFVIQYISNLPFIQLLRDQGVNLDVYYKFLWLHEIMSKIIKECFAYRGLDFIQILTARIKNTSRIVQMKKYFKTYGNIFFEEKGAEKVTTELEASVKASFPTNVVSGGLTEVQRKEIQTLASLKINDTQINQLRNIIYLLKDFLEENSQRKILVTIDDLDQNWVDVDSKYKLIGALLDAVRLFTDVPSLKILLAMRSDLLLKTCNATGRQTEKDMAFTLKLNWSQDSLFQILDLRIAWLFRHKYSKSHQITFYDIFKDCEISGVDAATYLIERTMMRPRDIITFVNLCIEESDNKTSVSEDAVLRAEKSFQHDRLNALYSEWQENIPAIRVYVSTLFVLPVSFTLSEIVENFYDKIESSILAEETYEEDSLVRAFLETSPTDLVKRRRNIQRLIEVGFLIGAVGKKDGNILVYSTPSIPELMPKDYNISDIEFILHPLFRK